MEGNENREVFNTVFFWAAFLVSVQWPCQNLDFWGPQSSYLSATEKCFFYMQGKSRKYMDLWKFDGLILYTRFDEPGPGNLQCSNVSSVNFNHFFVVSLKTSYFVENQPVWFNPVLYYNFGGQTPWVFFNRMGSISLEPTGRTKCTAKSDESMPVGIWRPAAGSTCRIWRMPLTSRCWRASSGSLRDKHVVLRTSVFLVVALGWGGWD